MKLILKKTKETSEGLLVEDKEVAIIEFSGGKTFVKCFDRQLKLQMEEILSVPFTVRKPVVRDGIRAFVMKMVQPNTEEYIREISYLLRKAGFHVIRK